VTTKNKLLFFFKFIVSLSLIYYLFITIPWGAVSEVIFSASIYWLIISVLVQILSFVFLALRWRVILRNLESNISFYETIKVSFIGIAVNNVLPSSIGGDFVRGAYVIKRGASLKNSILSLVTDRVLGLFIVLVFASIFLFLYGDIHPSLNHINNIVIFMILALLLIIFLTKTHAFMGLFKRVLNIILSSSFYNKTASMIDDIYHYQISKNVVLKVFFITIIAMFLEVLVFWLASKSLGMDYSFYIFIISVPLIVIISVLPISLGGFLVRESSGLFLLNMLGLEMIHASSIVILFIPILLFSSIPGVYFYLISD
jgi:glycosyltransferase 2 family protein